MGLGISLLNDITVEESGINYVQNTPYTVDSINEFVQKIADHFSPEKVHFVDGSEEEYQRLIDIGVERGSFIRLNPEKRPNSILVRSDPKDVARVEGATYINCEKFEDAGFTNNWRDPKEMMGVLTDLSKNCMVGRTLYVIPFSMGPPGAIPTMYGIEITDSEYVVINMRIMARVGNEVVKYLNDGVDFVPCIHSVCAPLPNGKKDVAWPCNPDNKYITHFQGEHPMIVSLGSGYGGNALLGKKCLALRVASDQGKRQGWMAEHMLLLRLTNPEGKQFHIAGAFPSACGKTNAAMLEPTLKDWSAECIGDDISWMFVGKDNKLHAINPEAGFFGVAPGTSYSSNHNAMRACERDCIFTNVALTDDGDVWWEDMSEAPAHLIDWQGNDWTPDCGRTAAHKNARYTANYHLCPIAVETDVAFNEDPGVAIDAIVFGGRRTKLMPLVYQSYNWQHGVFVGATLASEMTAAAEGKQGVLRRDPMAMLPFIGYNVGDYWKHWLEMGLRLGNDAPKIFHVNWFGKDENNKFLWPGFGDNVRVFKWITERCENPEREDNITHTALGNVPSIDALDVNDINIDDEQMRKLLKVDSNELKGELEEITNFLHNAGEYLPCELEEEIINLQNRL
eukprot:TRINITY_DN11684_c0_g1_i1.p1 TRINITY_DN11684_c0_g1~~TRINITY_DN11684_c0_g1_i1.p1  ORF type:complete len:623 (+),score=213.24 TRINITY_DN11684_c0_g1_i1:39-1907(+)